MNLTRLWVDFNEVYDEDYIWTSVRRTPGVQADTLGREQLVELYDDDGATCWATIVEVKGYVVTCRINWTTWRSMRVDPVLARVPTVKEPVAYRTPVDAQIG